MWEKEKDLLCFFSNKGIYIIKIIKLLEDSGVLIDDVTGAVKDEIKAQEGEFLGALLALLPASFV